MILTREDVKELQASGSLEVLLAALPAKDVQSVQVAVATPAVCLVRVVDHWPHRAGGEVVVLELVKRLKPSPPRTRKRSEQVRLMKPRRGTTRDPRSAMRSAAERPEPVEETTGVPHPNLTDSEPEMVDEGTENRFAQKAHQASELRYIDQLREVEKETRYAEQAERLGIDITSDLAALARRKREIERKLTKAERKKAA